MTDVLAFVGLLGLFSALAAVFSRYHNPISDSISPVSIITLSSFFVLHLTKAGKGRDVGGKKVASVLELGYRGYI